MHLYSSFFYVPQDFYLGVNLYQTLHLDDFGGNKATKLVHGLSNRAIFNDLERPQIQISRSDNSLTLNISEMAKDTAVVTMTGE